MPITVDSPLAAAANSAASFFASQQDAKKADAEAKRQAAKEAADEAFRQQQQQLEQAKFSEEVQQHGIENAAAQAAALLDAKKEAAGEVEAARKDALDSLRLKYENDKDQRAYHLGILRLQQTHNDAMAKIKADRDIASVRASATLGAAQIHASAELQSAGMREAGAQSRLNQSENFQQQQQARTFKHTDATKKASPYSSELPALSSPAFHGLPATTQAHVRSLVAKYGIDATTKALQDVASGKRDGSKFGLDKASAAQALAGLSATSDAYKQDPSVDDPDDDQ